MCKSMRHVMCKRPGTQGPDGHICSCFACAPPLAVKAATASALRIAVARPCVSFLLSNHACSKVLIMFFDQHCCALRPMVGVSEVID